jgi:hypothetical protein
MKSLSLKVLAVSLVLLAALFVVVPGVSMAVQGGNLDMSPNGTLGQSHINMYKGIGIGGPVCTDCHTSSFLPPPTVTDPAADMKPNHCCSECHPQGGKPDLFISHMSQKGFPSYCRCSDCHKIRN